LATSGRRLAAFDFDGTISRKDTLIPFLLRATGRARFASGWRQVVAAGARGRVDLRDRDAVKAELIEHLLADRLEPIAREFGLHGVVGVEPEVCDGRLTGSLCRPNVRAEQKVVQLDAWLSAQDLVPETGHRSAYGNTSGDHALLRAADHRYWLGRPGKVPDGAEMLTAATPLR